MKKLLYPFCLFTLFLLPMLACQYSASTEDGRAERPSATSTPAAIVRTPEDRPISVEGNLTDSEAPTVTESVTTEIDLSTLSTEEQLLVVAVPTRDLADLALRLKPGIDEIPSVVNEDVPDHEVGSEQQFWVHNSQTNANTQITAQLIHKTDVAYAWVQTEQDFDGDAIAKSIDTFSVQSYPAEREFFGSERRPGIDNDPRVHILHTTETGAGIAGYFSSADSFSRLANQYSNEKEMFYISLSWLNSISDYETYETVLAHEFQHMVHWANDRNEETWVNEGMSEFAQEVAGYEPDTGFARSFSNQPDTQLNTWNEVNSGNGNHYGSSYLFMAYFAQRFGPEVTKAVVANPLNGTAGFTATLAEAGYTDTFESVFSDWLIANYVDDVNALGLDGFYGYRKFEQSAPSLEQTYETYPASDEATVKNYAADYILLKGEKPLVVEFSGQNQTRLADTTPYSGERTWWSNRSDDSDSHLTRKFDFSTLDSDAFDAENPLLMDVAMWWNIEVDYDYGYVLASRDGKKWDILTGQNTTLDNPSGNSFGHAYTGTSPAPDDTESGEPDVVGGGILKPIDTVPHWRSETFDLSAYAGSDVYIRFEYVNDDAVNRSGWLIDDIQIPAIGYTTDFENGADGWESEGWLLTDNKLTQRWLLQVASLEDNVLIAIDRVMVDLSGEATLTIDSLGPNKSAVLIISALAPVTTEAAAYSYTITENEEIVVARQ